MTNTKSGIGNAMENVHKDYGQLVQKRLRPLDEYDRFHIQKWQTVDVIRERFEECFEEEDCSEDEDCSESKNHLTLMDQAMDQAIGNTTDATATIEAPVDDTISIIYNHGFDIYDAKTQLKFSAQKPAPCN